MNNRRNPPNLPIAASAVPIKVESNQNGHFDARNDRDIGNTSFQLPKSAGRGRATTLPAWMTSQVELPLHSPFVAEPVQPSQHQLTSQPPLPPGPAPAPEHAPPLPIPLHSPPLTPQQASRATKRGTRGGRHRRRRNNAVTPPPFTNQPSTPYSTVVSAPGPDTPIFHPGAGFVASGAVRMMPLPFPPVCFLQPPINMPSPSLCNCGNCYIPVLSKVFVQHGVVFSANHSFAWHH